MEQVNNYGVEISPTAVQEQITGSKPQKDEKVEVKFSLDNYLQTNLEPGQTERTMQIRLLPITPDANTPFVLVHAHYLRVPKEVSKNGWKRFVCPVKNGFDEKIDSCPFCVIEKETTESMRNAVKDSAEYKNLKDIAFQYRSKPMWICRCIDREHEDQGVKWWMFPHQEWKNDGIIDKLNAIEKTAQRKDPNYTIYSLAKGKDLILTITGTVVNGKIQKSINIVADDEKTPISEDFNKAMKWIHDPVKWTDVYKVKPYDYMSIIAEGGIPSYDKDLKRYVNIAKNVDATANGLNSVSTEEEAIAAKEVQQSIPEDKKFQDVPKFNPDVPSAVNDLPF